MVKLGDKKQFVPAGFNAHANLIDPKTKKPVANCVVGRVVYVHPARRYYTVEVEMNGAVFRESFLGCV